MAGRPWTRAKALAKSMRQAGIAIPAGTMDRSDPKGTLDRLHEIWKASPQFRQLGEAVKARLEARGLDPDNLPVFDPPELPGADFQLPDPSSQGDDADEG